MLAHIEDPRACRKLTIASGPARLPQLLPVRAAQKWRRARSPRLSSRPRPARLVRAARWSTLPGEWAGRRRLCETLAMPQTRLRACALGAPLLKPLLRFECYRDIEGGCGVAVFKRSGVLKDGPRRLPLHRHSADVYPPLPLPLVEKWRPEMAVSGTIW